ncbi:hypothetical protein J5N97_024763 [Dioscorea zingiberensis]|uniref:DNA-directed primase/polymerase protein n=1 Tax=Dioscorea zingiberensis TaxID=325984 RepID=A0A9D5H8X5_9LILI|nr:hypothetical protein J5N97_024763 [Dioscorea zingiberensis]
MASDHNDDVDRLFACFKCGTSTPESALKERKSRHSASSEKSARAERNTLRTSSSLAIKLKHGKQISPVVFYGSPHGAPVKRPSQLLRLLREIHVDLREQNDLLARKEVWATFPRQEEAIRFSRAHTQVKIFCYQDHLSSQRRYLVSTYDEFWRRYTVMDPKLRHHYEVIQEGLPCHLYFDLEFDKKVNPGRNVDEMVDILISFTLSTLFNKYCIQGSEDWVLELDSSTEEKFSRHLIVRIPNTAFKDNSHVGVFISEVCANISSLRGNDPQVDKLYIKKDSSCTSSETQLFLDSAVYTRNRCFRLVLSSKAGKKSFLLPTKRFKCKGLSQKQLFMDSLICKVDVDCNKLLVCKMDLDCMKMLTFESEVHDQNLYVRKEFSRHDGPVTYFSGKAPFPALDVFIESIASVGNISGKIRSWYWFSAHNLMIYNMSRSRYCENIGREHKSNHVMYIVDFRIAGYYQKCYDPDCRGYRSPLRPLPSDVMLSTMGILKSLQIENYEMIDVIDVNFDLQAADSNMEQSLKDNSVPTTDSTKKDTGWWQKAMQYADCIENWGNVSESNKLDDDDGSEDLGWWINVEEFVSQVEESVADV